MAAKTQAKTKPKAETETQPQPQTQTQTQAKTKTETKAKAKAKTKATKSPPPGQPLHGLRFAFFGTFASWPRYHGASPERVAARLGATVTDELDESLDRLVLGDARGTGRAEAKKRGEALVKAGHRLRILDEASYRDLVRIDLTGKRFAFAGGFDCSPEGLEGGLLRRMVEAVGGAVADDLDATLDYLVVGNRRGPSKIARVNQADKLIAAGARLAKLDEAAFLDLVRIETSQSGGALDFAGFVNQLYATVNHGKLGRALDMLRKEKFQLYARLDDSRLVGVVRSQSGSGTVYASWLTPDGHYGCAQPDLSECMGLQGAPCKHLLVLVVGLARVGTLPLDQGIQWIQAAERHGPREDGELSAETFLQYKGAQAGELDWRPTETIPEDFYAL